MRAAMRLTIIGCGDAFGAGGRLQTSFHVRSRRLDLSDRLRGNVADRHAPARASSRTRSTPCSSRHLHGDHFGGLPWLLVDAHLCQQRARGRSWSRGRAASRRASCTAAEALYPGITTAKRSFELIFVEYAGADAARGRRRHRHAVRGESSFGRAALCAALRARRQGGRVHRRHRLGRGAVRGGARRRPVHLGMLPIRRRRCRSISTTRPSTPITRGSVQSACCSPIWGRPCWQQVGQVDRLALSPRP